MATELLSKPVDKPFQFEMNTLVRDSQSGTVGPVKGRCEYQDGSHGYFLLDLDDWVDEKRLTRIASE
jgi:hypothetical protein